MESLERLQGLHADLQAFANTRMVNIDRLRSELEQSILEFRQLLDKPVVSPTEKEAYQAGKITIDEQEFGINNEFKHLSQVIATALDLDEVAAGKLVIEGTNGTQTGDESLVTDAIGIYYDRRDVLLQGLRIILEESQDFEAEEEARSMFQDVAKEVLDIVTGPASNGSAFLSRCLRCMEDVENATVKINDQLQTKVLLSQMRGPEFYATLEFQKSSLFKQHEALGAIATFLFRANYTVADDLRKLYSATKRWQRLDMLWIHYLPAFAAAFRQYASAEGPTSTDDVKSLNELFAGISSETANLPARPLFAVLELWWIAEYAGWFRESSVTNADSEKRTKAVQMALEQDALEFLLSLCSSVHLEMWKHPTRQELIALLLGNKNGIQIDTDQITSPFFTKMLMESIESFAEAWITNMPDSIRRLKNDEDDQRLVQITSSQKGEITPAEREHLGRLHLETFLVLIAFAFEHRPDAAEQFWDDPDGNLYGFVQWASKRQTVPRVSAFCEMLCAIAEGQENAIAAHKFLLDDAVVAPTPRSRRVPTMNYQQIFAELELYARKVHEKVPSTQIRNANGELLSPDFSEVESPIMLSCYVRLLAHLCRHNQTTRQFIFGNTFFDPFRILLQLASGTVPSYLRATVFQALEALLTDKSPEISSNMWKAIDQWASTSHDVLAASKSGQPDVSTLAGLHATFASIASSYDQYDAFIDLLRALVSPVPAATLDTPPMTFPADLGSSYRSPGILPYVDFTCGQVFTKRVRELGDESRAMICSYHCVDFVATVLEGFNENYVAMFDQNLRQQSGGPHVPDQAIVYAQRHPFARAMQWIFGIDMQKTIFQMLHGRLNEAETAPADSPVVLLLTRCIDVISMVLDLQATYFDLVRPLLKDTDASRSIHPSGVSCFEEAVATHSDLILDLCQYAATSHLQLSLHSLALLQKLTGSPRLNHYFASGTSENSWRLVDMLGTSSEAVLRSVSSTLAVRLQLDVRELEEGYESLGYLMKDGILAFLNSCLGFQPDSPNVAHLLLGFGRIKNQLTVTSAIDQGSSLLDVVVTLITDFPDGQDGSLVSWLIHIKAAGMRVLTRLLEAPVSMSLTLAQLRRLNFLGMQFQNQSPVSQSTLWDGQTISSPDFWFSSSAGALTEFFLLRAYLYNFATKEINTIGQEQVISIQKQVLSTLQGKTIHADGSSNSHLTIFDLFDFADLDLSAKLHLPTDLQHFGHYNWELFKITRENGPLLYDIPVIREVLSLTQESQTTSNKTTDPESIQLETDLIVDTLEARNRWESAHSARNEALHNYVDMLVSAVSNSSMEVTSRAQFALRNLQILLPKLDTFIVEAAPEALELARAAESLVLALSKRADITSTSTPTGQSRADSVILERLFQLFRICIEGIPLSNSSVELRTILYGICSQFLARILDTPNNDGDASRKARNNSMDCIRSVSVRLISLVADDADDGSDQCRLNALNLLSMLTSLASSQQSNLIVESLVKFNVLEIILEPFRTISADFSKANTNQRPFLINLHEARSFLLLTVSMSRSGATSLLEAGLLPALKDSVIFRADPDLGMDLELSNPITTSPTKLFSGANAGPGSRGAKQHSALMNYFVLLSSCLRLLLSTFMGRGVDNEQISYQVRTFLSEHRSNMVGVYKKAAGVNGAVMDGKLKHVIEDCARSYAGLAAGCGFIEFEDERVLGEGSGGIHGRGGFS